jgi:hypothetical protein
LQLVKITFKVEQTLALSENGQYQDQYNYTQQDA